MFRSRSSESKLRVAWTVQLSDHIVGLSWSPDGSLLAAAVISGPISILDAATGQARHQFAGHGFGTSAIAWQPDGLRLASAGQDGKVRLWNTSSGIEELALEGGSSWVEGVKWNAAGSLLAATAGKKARIWDSTGALIRELPAQGGTITDLAWHPERDQLAVLAYGAANIFDPATGELVRSFQWKGSPLALAWSPDGKVLAHGNQDATVHFWYAETGLNLQMSGYPSKVRELSWDFSNRYLATGGGPMPCIWDCGGSKGPEGTRPQMLEGHEENLTAVAYQSRGHLLASSSLDGRVILWQPANKKAPKIGEFRFEGAEASAMAWSGDNERIVAGASTGALALLRVG